MSFCDYIVEVTDGAGFTARAVELRIKIANIGIPYLLSTSESKSLV